MLFSELGNGVFQILNMEPSSTSRATVALNPSQEEWFAETYVCAKDVISLLEDRIAKRSGEAKNQAGRNEERKKEAINEVQKNNAWKCKEFAENSIYIVNFRETCTAELNELLDILHSLTALHLSGFDVKDVCGVGRLGERCNDFLSELHSRILQIQLSSQELADGVRISLLNNPELRDFLFPHSEIYGRLSEIHKDEFNSKVREAERLGINGYKVTGYGDGSFEVQPRQNQHLTVLSNYEWRRGNFQKSKEEWAKEIGCILREIIDVVEGNSQETTSNDSASKSGVNSSAEAANNHESDTRSNNVENDMSNDLDDDSRIEEREVEESSSSTEMKTVDPTEAQHSRGSPTVATPRTVNVGTSTVITGAMLEYLKMTPSSEIESGTEQATTCAGDRSTAVVAQTAASAMTVSSASVTTYLPMSYVRPHLSPIVPIAPSPAASIMNYSPLVNTPAQFSTPVNPSRPPVALPGCSSFHHPIWMSYGNDWRQVTYRYSAPLLYGDQNRTSLSNWNQSPTYTVISNQYPSYTPQGNPIHTAINANSGYVPSQVTPLFTNPDGTPNYQQLGASSYLAPATSYLPAPVGQLQYHETSGNIIAQPANLWNNLAGSKFYPEFSAVRLYVAC